MKRFTVLLFFFVLVAPAWAGRKITVGQLEDLLRSMQQDKKSDTEVATALKQVELSEELTRGTMNSLVKFAQGPLTTEQIFVLEARSADLIPPASDLPATPAPDDDARKAILARAETYTTHVYAQLPALSARRTTLRFQDNMDAVGSSSGIVGSATDVVTTPGFSKPAEFVHYINSTATAVTFDHGAEKLPQDKEKIPWGANKMTALQSPGPSLGAVFHEAEEAGGFQWLRWELINGKPAAVFSFAVPQKSSTLDVKVCCFPKIDQQGVAHFYNATTGGAAFGGESGTGGVAGDWQTTTDWHDFKATPAYHGEIFVDPTTGVLVRMITEAELKPTDVVHQVDMRVDFGVVNAGGRMVVVPVKSYVNTVVVPGGESGSGIYAIRCTLFTSEYSGYEAGPTR